MADKGSSSLSNRLISLWDRPNCTPIWQVLWLTEANSSKTVFELKSANSACALFMYTYIHMYMFLYTHMHTHKVVVYNIHAHTHCCCIHTYMTHTHVLYTHALLWYTHTCFCTYAAQHILESKFLLLLCMLS